MNEKEKEASLGEMDITDLLRRLWIRRRFILKACCVGILAGIIVAFSIPKEYTTKVVLAVETGNTGAMGTLAAISGVNLRQQNQDMISPELYPNIIKSTPFLLGLLDVKVPASKSEEEITLFKYFEDYQKTPWWKKLTGLPSKAVARIRGNNIEKSVSDPDCRYHRLTAQQKAIMDNLSGRLTAMVDNKTGVVTLASTMQSPEVSALVADTLTSYLQSYVISYRTEKARQDLAFYEHLYEEARQDYSEKQRRYAAYSDQNQNVILASYRINLEKLQNEMSLAFSVYNQMAQQLQAAKIQVQDQTPVYKVIEPAVLPEKASKPRKQLIVLGFVVLFGATAATWVLTRGISEDRKS